MTLEEKLEHHQSQLRFILMASMNVNPPSSYFSSIEIVFVFSNSFEYVTLEITHVINAKSTNCHIHCLILCFQPGMVSIHLRGSSGRSSDDNQLSVNIQ